MQHLEDLLSTDEDVLHSVYEWWEPPVRRIPPLLVVRIRGALGSYIAERSAHGKGCLFYQTTFKRLTR